jgi:hypothetical protein
MVVEVVITAVITVAMVAMADGHHLQLVLLPELLLLMHITDPLPFITHHSMFIHHNLKPLLIVQRTGSTIPKRKLVLVAGKK